MKIIKIEHIFTEGHWKEMRRFYSEKQIRTILKEVGQSELRELTLSHLIQAGDLVYDQEGNLIPKRSRPSDIHQ